MMETKSFCEIQGANGQATSVGSLPGGVSRKMMKCSRVPKPTLAEEETAGRKAKGARCRLNSTLAQCGRFPVLLVTLFIYCPSSVTSLQSHLVSVS